MKLKIKKTTMPLFEKFAEGPLKEPEPCDADHVYIDLEPRAIEALKQRRMDPSETLEAVIIRILTEPKSTWRPQ